MMQDDAAERVLVRVPDLYSTSGLGKLTLRAAEQDGNGIGCRRLDWKGRHDLCWKRTREMVLVKRRHNYKAVDFNLNLSITDDAVEISNRARVITQAAEAVGRVDLTFDMPVRLRKLRGSSRPMSGLRRPKRLLDQTSSVHFWPSPTLKHVSLPSMGPPNR